jgi:hypothetical protein
MLMPAFSFEKISPPPLDTAATATVVKTDQKSYITGRKKLRGVIVQVLDRIAEARARRSPNKHQPAPLAEQSNG